MPEDDVDHFTERSTKRGQLFDDAAQRLPTTKLSPVLWSFLQICDLEKLKNLTQNTESWNNIYREVRMALSEYEAIDAVRLWKQYPQIKGGAVTPTKRSLPRTTSNQSPSLPLSLQSASPTNMSRTRSAKPLGGPEHSPVRNRQVAERCKKRDHDLCVISRISAVEACHIYPWYAFGGRDSTRVENFWMTLRMFWPKDKVDSWYKKIFQDERTDVPRGTETCENMLTLTSTLHRFHSAAAFALRPVRVLADKTQLELEFHWLPYQQRDSTAEVDLLEQPLSSRGRKESKPGYQFFRSGEGGPSNLISGTRFTMTTDDPILLPLPDPGLLELQWHLQRILAMSGAAGWTDEDFKHDDPYAGADALPSVEQWLDDQSVNSDQGLSSSQSEPVEFVDGEMD